MNILCRYIIEEEINYLIDYLKLIEATIRKNNEAFYCRELEMKVAGVTSFEVDASGDIYDPYEAIVYDSCRSEGLHQRMLGTLVIGVFIFLEHSIKSACTKLEKEQQIIFSAKDLRGNGITPLVAYLKKVSGFDFPIDKKLREEFDTARIIRNSLVHANAVINEHDFRIISSYIKLNPDLLSMSELQEIILTEKYANELINLSSKICDDLEKLVELN